MREKEKTLKTQIIYRYAFLLVKWSKCKRKEKIWEMYDFFEIIVKENKKRGITESITIAPKFLIGKSQDLMIRGSDFYAVWDDEEGLWSKKERTVNKIIDR